MKSIMISIQPQWVEKILNGEKTIEIRKTMPKCDLPVKVYIYCTKSFNSLRRFPNDERFGDLKNKFDITTHNRTSTIPTDIWNGKVVAEFTLNKIEGFSKYEYDFGALVRHLDLWAGTKGNYPFLIDYLKGQKKGYAWHIDNLKIYDEPKDLSEFSTILHRMKCKESRFTSHLLQRPFQSWGYVEDIEND